MQIWLVGIGLFKCGIESPIKLLGESWVYKWLQEAIIVTWLVILVYMCKYD